MLIEEKLMNSPKVSLEGIDVPVMVVSSMCGECKRSGEMHISYAPNKMNLDMYISMLRH